jgi:hypothetical protein
LDAVVLANQTQEVVDPEDLFVDVVVPSSQVGLRDEVGRCY